MPNRSEVNRYGMVAVIVHWLSVLLIAGLLITGLRAPNVTDLAAKIDILRVHVPLGLVILSLTLFRIIWWWRFDMKPGPIAGTLLWQERSAKAVHILVYVLILGMAATGIGMMAMSGAGQILFLGEAGPLPDFFKYVPRVPHGIGGRVLIALLAAHIGAALYHHFVCRDGVVKRMWFAGTSR